jgi:hypothetical protein
MAAFTKSVRQKSAFDFRFADDEDCEDMAESIAAGYKEEEGRQRSSEALWTGAEIEKDMSEASVKWLLIETPRPEEMVRDALPWPKKLTWLQYYNTPPLFLVIS